MLETAKPLTPNIPFQSYNSFQGQLRCSFLGSREHRSFAQARPGWLPGLGLEPGLTDSDPRSEFWAWCCLDYPHTLLHVIHLIDFEPSNFSLVIPVSSLSETPCL